MSSVNEPKNRLGKRHIFRDIAGVILCAIGGSLFLYPIFEHEIGNFSLSAVTVFLGLALVLHRPKSDAEEAEQFILRKK